MLTGITITAQNIKKCDNYSNYNYWQKALKFINYLQNVFRNI